MEYSHVNNHIFMRGYVCCSCGFEGSDLGMECGRGTPKLVDVVTGRNKANNVTGKCGHSCEGSPADVLGVLEWDTKSKDIIGYHLNSLGYGADPYIDPSGKYLIMLANDGGREATIIKTGKNGERSEQLAIVDTGFSEEDGEKGIWDVCFIEHENYDIAIFVSTLANFVVLADMSPLESGGTITTEKIWLTDDQQAEVTSNHGRGARRNCAWAFGSPYVWVDAGKTEEVHILKLSMKGGKPTATRIRNVANTPSRFLAWVSNHEQDVMLAQAEALIAKQTDSSIGVAADLAIAALVFGLVATSVSVCLLAKYNILKGNIQGEKAVEREKEAPIQEAPVRFTNA